MRRRPPRRERPPAQRSSRCRWRLAWMNRRLGEGHTPRSRLPEADRSPHPAPWTLDLGPCAPHAAPCTCALHPAPCTLRPARRTLCPARCTLCPARCTLHHHGTCTLHPAPFTLPPTPASCRHPRRMRSPRRAPSLRPNGGRSQSARWPLKRQSRARLRMNAPRWRPARGRQRRRLVTCARRVLVSSRLNRARPSSAPWQWLAANSQQALFSAPARVRGRCECIS
mmetsp:Transcript_3799/g.8292  ORF Transcript_3799/g.8292 Transcript_3799/m.8292 type:complete len:225 (+) Transcript_3799:185-859(+)